MTFSNIHDPHISPHDLYMSEVGGPCGLVKNIIRYVADVSFSSDPKCVFRVLPLNNVLNATFPKVNETILISHFGAK